MPRGGQATARVPVDCRQAFVDRSFVFLNGNKNEQGTVFLFEFINAEVKIHNPRPFLDLAKQAKLLPEEEQLLSVVTRKLIEAESNHTTKSVAHS
jgi:hypothetical protein